jgi:uncharacterized protein with HEPN domain
VSRDWRLYLDDIVEYSDRALRYTEGLTYEQFVASDQTYDATVRCLEVIGEAAKNVPDQVRRHAPSVPWAQIAGFRNRLAHGYFILNNELVWDVIQQHLPPLRTTADRLRSDPLLSGEP